MARRKKNRDANAGAPAAKGFVPGLTAARPPLAPRKFVSDPKQEACKETRRPPKKQGRKKKKPKKPERGTQNMPAQNMPTWWDLAPPVPKREPVNPSGPSRAWDQKRSITYDKYGMKQSRDRLERQGFHPAVTTKTPREVIDAWLKVAVAYSARPTPAQYKNGAFNFLGTKYSKSPRQITRGLLVMRDHYVDKHMPQQKPLPDSPVGLEHLLEVQVIGSQITKLVFQDGIHAVQNLALTSTRVWGALAQLSYSWDFSTGRFLGQQGRNGVFLVLNPESTVTEVVEDQNNTPLFHCGIIYEEPDVPNKLDVVKEEKALRMDAAMTASHVRFSLGYPTMELEPIPDYYPCLDTTNGLFQAFRRSTQLAQSAGRIIRPFQFSELGTQVYRPLASVCVKRLYHLLTQMHQQRTTIETIYFEKTPFLDRRVLATILRGCTAVTVVGIYDCPLIHFGDIICILDLIHEINRERKKKKIPLIKALDFSPRFNSGMPFRNGDAATYGITWNPQSLEVVQRGFYMILMKAFLKARHMDMGLLFAKDKAFMKYLARVPTQPLGVPSFLDALYRHIELNPEDEDFHNQRRQTIYDILKPVRLGTAGSFRILAGDWPRFYMRLEEQLVFCASCGYKTLRDFFTEHARSMPELVRGCAGCVLQQLLDEERDHAKVGKKIVLDSLFSAWNGKEFNLDAPIPDNAQSLLKLHSTTSIRPKPPGPITDAYGDLEFPDYEEPLLRDGKRHWDSLQNLPTLGELVAKSFGNDKGKTVQAGVDLEKFRICMRVYEEEEKDRALARGTPYNQLRLDVGRQDYDDERQFSRLPGDPPPYKECHGFVEAKAFHDELVKMGW